MKKRITVQLDAQMTQEFERMKSEQLERDGTVIRDSELARILLRSALNNEPQQIVADEALIRIGSITGLMVRRVREFLQSDLKSIMEEVEEQMDG